MQSSLIPNSTLTALKGVRVGHATHPDKLTGCTVVLFDHALPVAYQASGGGCATFNTDTLRAGSTFNHRHGLFIAGGSLSGLMSATPIMQEMIKQGIGDKMANIINPSISGAVVFDLGTTIGQFDPNFGKDAYRNASTKPVASGDVGAGTGTTVGKFAFLENGTKHPGMKTGVGSARIDLGKGIMVCALTVVNALGNVVNRDGTICAGNRDGKGSFLSFNSTKETPTTSSTLGTNTTISIVGTNAKLPNREEYERLARLATHGQVRAIHPVQTGCDGDTVFLFSTEEVSVNELGDQNDCNSRWPSLAIDRLGYAASQAVQDSIYDACNSSKTIPFAHAVDGIIPSVR